MNKTVKRVILVFTVLCALLLIVFSLELILINRDTDKGNAEPSQSGSPPPGNGNSNQGSETPGTSTPDTDSGNRNPAPAGGTQPPPPPPPTGTRYERLMPDDSELVYYVDGDYFNHTETEHEDILDRFSYRGTGTAGLEIRFVFMPHGVNTYAENFLELNFGITNASVEGEEYICRSPLRGVFVSGTGNETTYETWVFTFSNPEFDDLGVVFLINYQNETQRNALYKILDSLYMVG